MSNEQKSQVIAEKVRLCIHDMETHVRNLGTPKAGLHCKKCSFISKDPLAFFRPNSDFFTPEGQKVLAGALRKLRDSESPKEKILYIRFNRYLNKKSLIDKADAILETIDKTNLAELFWEFLQTEKDK